MDYITRDEDLRQDTRAVMSLEWCKIVVFDPVDHAVGVPRMSYKCMWG